jgi:hypothetical protein
VPEQNAGELQMRRLLTIRKSVLAGHRIRTRIAAVIPDISAISFTIELHSRFSSNINV